ncbi:kelch like protein [Anaeramoeba ignava]|uniref:Kelch like protein n=1 Tax=Anaeramoeba ignava TaxID=1746090 RepID=A0A9Q0LS18_ANAIG|nr:kelch like protein [Anaeramoeba ignava]
MNNNLLQLTKKQLDDLLSSECSTDFKKMLETEESLFDFTIICGKNLKSFRCHKLVLSSRSQFFHALFRSKFITEINFPQFEFEIVYSVIRFLYTGEIQINQQFFDHYYILADKLMLPKLQIRIQKEIQESLTKYNLVNFYSKSKRISSDFLIQSCADFLIQNINKMIQKNQIQNLKQNEIICFIEMILSNKKANKLDLIPDLIIEWFKHNNLETQTKNRKPDSKNQQNEFSNLIFHLLQQVQSLHPITEYQMNEIQKFSFFPSHITFKLINQHIENFNKTKKQIIIEKKEFENQKQNLVQEKQQFENQKKDLIQEKKEFENQKKDLVQEKQQIEKEKQPEASKYFSFNKFIKNNFNSKYFLQ